MIIYTDYKIVQGSTPKNLEEGVLKLLNDGFIPFGSIAVSDGGHLYREMVKYKELTEEEVKQQNARSSRASIHRKD